VGCPWQHLHGFIQHLEAALPVILVSIAVEEQAVECSTECKVILGLWGREEEGDTGRQVPYSLQIDLMLSDL
jgi:hypothetical protein